MPGSEFVILGDAIWIDFVNTSKGTGPVLDRLGSMEAYRRWVQVVKLIPDDPQIPFEEIIDFRDRLTALAHAIGSSRQAPAVSIHAINAILAQTTGFHQLTRVQGNWRSVFTPLRPPTALDAVGRSAAATLADVNAVVRQCSGPGCTLYFVDNSPNHSRRWCSSATCGKQMRVDRRRTAR
ncbi:MAG: CGNR zinc finger domain-containing protein [Gemmatimonadota bacterium]